MKSTDVIAEAVMAAISKASPEGTPEAARGSEMLQRLDSLGRMIAFADIQAALGLEFEPEHMMQLFLCPTVEEMVVLISDISSKGKSDARVDP